MYSSGEFIVQVTVGVINPEWGCEGHRNLGYDTFTFTTVFLSSYLIVSHAWKHDPFYLKGKRLVIPSRIQVQYY